ncbi:MAG: universal stress protein [Deltaproteobacteria bacterium]|nr:universal stress protein [Deltaproteobacteria bacterium]
MKVQIKNIVCTTDFSDLSNQAVPFGVALAREYDAKLYLCHVMDMTSTSIYGAAYIDMEDLRQRTADYALEEFERLVGDAQVDWEPLITVGHVADEIARMAKERCADLVVSCTHGPSGLKRFVLGSVAERLLRTLPCPLLSIHGTEKHLVDPEKQVMRFRKILVGCDFSSDSNLAFQYALSLAQEFQSELHLAHAIAPPVYRHLFQTGAETDDERRHDLRDRLNASLTNMIPDEVRNWCTPSTILLAGSPHEELIKYAMIHHIELIVLGVRGHGLTETLLVGSTTDRVIRKAPCPVLSVRPMVQVV